jgi:hypothetical protein
MTQTTDPRRLGIRDRVEPGHDVRQSRQAQRIAEPERHLVPRVLQEIARKQETWPVPRLVRAEENKRIEPDLPQRHQQNDCARRQQEHGFDNLHPAGREHAAGGDVDDHAEPHEHDGNVVGQPEQQLQ